MNALLADVDAASSQVSRVWHRVCEVEDIVPDTGVCALIEGCHVAVFRVGRDQFFALDNIDPKMGASVLARGLIGSIGDRVVVASPLLKQHYELCSGVCLEDPSYSVRAYPVRVEQGQVSVALA